MAPIVGGTVILRDGTRYRFEGGLLRWMRDRNGNKLTFTYTSGYHPMYGQQLDGGGGHLLTKITDSLNREVNFAYNVTDPQYGVVDKITFNGLNGVRTISIKIPGCSMCFARINRSRHTCNYSRACSQVAQPSLIPTGLPMFGCQTARLTAKILTAQ